MAPTSFRILKTLALSAVASLAVVACGGGGGGGNGNLASDQTLNFPILGDFGTLDPATADAETDQEIQQNFQDGLVRFDANLNLVPDLATAAPYAGQVKLSRPAGWFMPAIALSGSTGWIVDQKAIKNDPDNWWSNPATAIGTGPFKMVSYTPKQSVEFDAVANWWGSPKPTLTKVKIDISVTNASTAITKYEQGGYAIVGYGGYSN